jgi:predicted AAA+ superfamily ATPase
MRQAMYESYPYACTVISMAPIVNRLIGKALLDAEGAQVVILEGARAVGKTTLMRSMIAPAGYSYATLADPATLRFAAADTNGWLRRLPRPAIIDEAQLLPDLPLLLKELVDELGSGTHFMLTGSASIGRTGLGGADPLTRRSRRFSMSPLTRWEIAGENGSLVDALFDHQISLSGQERVTDEQLLEQMRVGGFPGYVFSNAIRIRRQEFEQIRSDVTAVLSDEVLPGNGFDSTIARSALDSLLRVPGGIFNASRLGQQLDLDRRTVDRYLGMFERLFLLHWLPNLATSPSRQSHARSKIHPVDTSLAVESLVRAGSDILTERENFGAVLESHVVNQVLASMPWAATHAEAYFWRQASKSSPEVDLVLVDDASRIVGIEVKASSSLHPRDIRTLQALEKDRGLHRGFIFYTGSEALQLADNIWALPITALEDSSLFLPLQTSPERSTAMTSAPPNPSAAPQGASDATMFLSYVHADNERSRGNVVQFAEDLVDTYAYLYGRKIELFVDRQSITWGESWSQRLRTEAESTSFLLAIVTPRYLQSEPCREELLSFSTAAETATEPKVLLPLQWVDITTTDVVDEADPVLTKIRSTQFEDVTEIRQLQPGSAEYDLLLERVAGRLKQTVGDRDSKKKSQPAAAHVADDRDLIEVMESLELHKDELSKATEAFKDAFDRIGGVFQNRPAVRAVQTYATAKAMEDLGKDLAGPVGDLESATTMLGDVWNHYDAGIARAVRVLRDMSAGDQQRELAETLSSLARSLDLPGSETMEQQMQTMGNFSRHLRPMSHAVSNALQLLRGIQTSSRAWQDQMTH